MTLEEAQICDTHSPSLELNFPDEKLAIQGFEDNSQISHLVELSFILLKTNPKFFKPKW
jgi:hypothetical protein